MNNLFESAAISPDVSLNPNHVLPSLEEPPSAFSRYMPQEATHPISYTIYTANSDFHDTQTTF